MALCVGQGSSMLQLSNDFFLMFKVVKMIHGDATFQR